jgi:hypothetical protein
MLISLSSARRIAAGAVGASAVAGAMLFGATPAANATPTFTHVAPASPAGFGSPLPDRPGFGGGHGGYGHGGFGRGGVGRGGFGHGGFGRGGFGHRGGFWGHRGGFGRGGFGQGGFGRGYGFGRGFGNHGWWR